ncbi:MAG TPA: MFS transporter [Candidatus Binataceae bacterium]|nr:MFS transporter [Candidatus Binataceae bacterium]
MPAVAESKPPAYRWVIEALVIVMLIAQVLTWLAPAPILGPMVKSLGISLGQAGLIISVIALCIAIFSFLGAFVAERIGTLKALLAGIWLMAVAEIASGFTTKFGGLLLCRVLEGVGYGIIIGPPAALVMQWFGEREWPWMNMVNSVCAYIGIFAVYAITTPLYQAVGASWQRVLTIYGIVAAVVALLWSILGRERQSATVSAVSHGPRPASNLPEVLRMPGVLLMAIALFGGMWVFQLYTAFLPEFFRTERGLTLGEAASLTALLPLSAIFAAALGGIGTAMVGLRRPFLWPIAVTTTIGCAGAVLFPSLDGIRVSLLLIGIGSAGGLAATGTLIMELPGMTPARMSTAFAFIWAVGYGGAFISPFLGGALAPILGLRDVMVGSLAFQLLPIVSMYLLPETGPGRKRIAMTSPEPAA